MKKVFLFFAASAMIVSVVAQKPAVNPIPVKMKQVVRPAVVDVNQSNLTFTQKPLGVNSKAITPVFVGSSSNPNGILVPQENQVAYNEALNVLSYTHRSGPYNASTLGSDVIGALSVNGGAAWDSTNVVYRNTNFPGRYPTGSLYNATGNTDIANLYSICAGPALAPTAFGATYIGWKKNSGVAKNYVINHGNTNRLERNNFQICQDGRFYFNGYAHLDDGTSYTKWNYTLVSGKLNAATDTVENIATTIIVPPYARFGTDTLGSGGYSAAVAFNKAGTVGYYAFLGVRSDVAVPSANTAYRPIVYKTIDAGTTWNIQPDFDFGTIPAFNQVLPGTAADTTKILPFFSSFDDIAVDANDNLHIISYVSGGSSTHVDSIGYTWTYNTIQGIMYDTYMTTGGAWDAVIIDLVNTKDVAAATPDLTYENRLQVGMSNDGKNIFYSWADSDPANTATNVLPDVYVAGRNIDSVNVIGKTCLTLGTTFENAATMHCMAPQVRDFGGEFYPYIVLTQLGATADNDPCKYYFLKDAKIVVGIETNNIDKNIANVSNIYPNPTNGLSNIDLSLLKSSNVTIEVVNMMGQVVSSDNLGNKAAGMHKLTVNANGLTSGIYFVTVKAGNSTNTSKLIVR